MKHLSHISLPFLLLCLVFLASCRGEDERIVLPTTEEAAAGGTSFYLLCEGNMGSNKASLDFYDGTTGKYHKNVFPSVNPQVTFELGDVGNDLLVAGEKMYAAINCSGLIEVMERRTAKHIGQIAVENCRNIVSNGAFVYVTSFAGPVSLNPLLRHGYVVKIDTASLQITARCEVGFQPEGMAVSEGRLFVANSGGYRAPDYDHTVSVIDLSSFTVEKTIDVALNLSVMATYGGRIYAGSRGNYEDIAPEIYVINPQTLTVEGALGIDFLNFCISDGILYAITVSGDVVAYDLQQHTREILIPKSETGQHPYGIAVDPHTRDILLTDARDYVSPGIVKCFDNTGKLRWQTVSGDIPAHFAFADDAHVIPSDTDEAANDIPIAHIHEYCPAPGQFVNLLPTYSEGDTYEQVLQKVFNAIGQHRRSLITLGAYGGYVSVGFSRPITNVTDEYDLCINGNAFENNAEPGVVWVMRDDNQNGLPDDTWYELAGSEYQRSKRHYTVTYQRPPATHTPEVGAEAWCADANYVYWSDSDGKSGYLAQNVYHQQPYFPAWLPTDALTLSGTLLPQNGVEQNGQWLLPSFGWGYADNRPNGTSGCLFKIDWAVDASGLPVSLDHIDFVKVQTGVHQQCGWIGETSTEITDIYGLH